MFKYRALEFSQTTSKKLDDIHKIEAKPTNDTRNENRSFTINA